MLATLTMRFCGCCQAKHRICHPYCTKNCHVRQSVGQSIHSSAAQDQKAHLPVTQSSSLAFLQVHWICEWHLLMITDSTRRSRNLASLIHSVHLPSDMFLFKYKYFLFLFFFFGFCKVEIKNKRPIYCVIEQRTPLSSVDWSHRI